MFVRVYSFAGIWLPDTCQFPVGRLGLAQPGWPSSARTIAPEIPTRTAIDQGRSSAAFGAPWDPLPDSCP